MAELDAVGVVDLQADTEETAQLKASRYDPQFVRRELWFLMNNLRLILRLGGRDLSQALILLFLARISCEDWCDADGMIAEPQARSFRAANTVAESFNWPFETVRRQLHRLVQAGLCQRGPSGFALATTGPNKDNIAEFLSGVRQQLLTFVAELVADGIAGDTADAANGSFLALVQASLDLSLAPIDVNRNTQPDWTKTLIYGSLVVLSSRHIAEDRAAWLALGDTLVPDDMRQPISIPQMAEFLCQPYSSIHRHMTEMAKLGILRKRGNGYIIPAQSMEADQSKNGTAARVKYTRQTLRRVAKLS